MNSLLVFIGGGIGAVMRHYVGIAISRHAGSNFPWHTFAVNLFGSFLIGILMELMALRTSLPETFRFFLITGFLGGFTTFSAFSLESSLMFERGDYFSCALYIGGSVLGSILLVFLGAGIVKTAF